MPIMRILYLAILLTTASSSLSPEDIPASCNQLIAQTGKSAVSYLANIAASVDTHCKQTCVASICDASALPSPASTSRFVERATTLVNAHSKKTGLRKTIATTAIRTILQGRVPQPGPGCLHKCSGHGSCLQDCRNKQGKECLQECKNYDSELLCVCSKRCVCNSDWAGEDCSQPLKCEGCNLKHGQCTNGKCLCDSGYQGTDCSQRVACPKGPGGFECGGDARGICDYGACTCKAGWEGLNCASKTPCPDNCSDNGFCVRGECQCFKGWFDASCATFKSGKPCSTQPEDAKDVCRGHGICFSGNCVCHPAYKGVECELKKQCPRGGKDGPQGMRNKQCSNKGECFMGNCICKPGYTGENCGTELPCDCSGHGVCHGGACVCNPGFKGTNCATEEFCPGKTLKSPQGCSDHGVCNDGGCFCFDGYAGDSCAFNLKDGQESERIKNCIDPNVKFHHGHSSTALSCSGHGVCGYDKLNKPAIQGGQDFGTCLCVPGFGGDYCEEEKKCVNDCNGHGQCYGGVCSCRYGYYGTSICFTCTFILSSAITNKCCGRYTLVLYHSPFFLFCFCQYFSLVLSKQSAITTVWHVHHSCDVLTLFHLVSSLVFLGADCSTLDLGIHLCPNNCGDHGTCMLEECFCEPGFIGVACNVTVPCPGVTEAGKTCSGRGKWSC